MDMSTPIKCWMRISLENNSLKNFQLQELSHKLELDGEAIGGFDNLQEWHNNRKLLVE